MSTGCSHRSTSPFCPLNVAGRKLVEEGDYCYRTNGRHVDLNRNYKTKLWGENEPLKECNPGPSPFSEAETRVVRDFAEAWKPDVFLCVHSGQESLLMPYAYEAKVPENSEAMERVLNTINNKWAHVGDRHVGPAGAKVGYLCHGTSLDYMYDTLKVPFSFAFEIFGGVQHERGNEASCFLEEEASEELASLDPEECFFKFNPIDEKTYNEVVNNWSKAFLDMADCALFGLC